MHVHANVEYWLVRCIRAYKAIDAGAVAELTEIMRGMMVALTTDDDEPAMPKKIFERPHTPRPWGLWMGCACVVDTSSAPGRCVFCMDCTYVLVSPAPPRTQFRVSSVVPSPLSSLVLQAEMNTKLLVFYDRVVLICRVSPWVTYSLLPTYMF